MCRPSQSCVCRVGTFWRYIAYTGAIYPLVLRRLCIASSARRRPARSHDGTKPAVVGLTDMDASGLCSQLDQNVGSWQRVAHPVPVPPSLCAGSAAGDKRCASANCRKFRDLHEWRPAGCRLVPWDTASFCALMGGRTMLWLGDSTMQEAASVVAAHAGWGARGCRGQVHWARSDTLSRTRYGANNAGGSWTKHVSRVKPDVVVLSAGAHIYGDDNFEQARHSTSGSSGTRDAPLLLPLPQHCRRCHRCCGMLPRSEPVSSRDCR